MFLSTISGKLSHPHSFRFTGNGKEPENTPEQDTTQAPGPSTDVFQPTKPANAAAPERRAHFEQTEEPAETPKTSKKAKTTAYRSGMPPRARIKKQHQNTQVPATPSSRVTDTFEQVEEPDSTPQTASTETSKRTSAFLRQAVPRKTPIIRRPHKPQPPTIRIDGPKELLPFKIKQAMNDSANTPEGMEAIPETPELPLIPKSHHTSLVPTMASTPKAQSVVSTHVSSSHHDEEDEDAVSEIASSNHSLSGDESDLNSEDWELFREELPDDHQSVRGEKSARSAKTHSSKAQSEISEEDADEGASTLTRSSQMSDETYFLHHENNASDDEDGSLSRSSSSQHNIPVATRQGRNRSHSDLSFHIKSPDEVEHMMAQRKTTEGELSRAFKQTHLTVPGTSAQRPPAAKKTAELDMRPWEDISRKLRSANELEKIKGLKEKFPLSKLRRFQQELPQKLHYLQQHFGHMAQTLGVNPPILQQRELALDARMEELHGLLQELSEDSTKHIDGKEKREQRKALNIELERAIGEKTQLQEQLNVFQPISIQIEQTKLERDRAQSAILLKLNTALEMLPTERHELVALSKTLAAKFTPAELRQVEQVTQRKEKTNAQRLHILQDLAKNNTVENLQTLWRQFGHQKQDAAKQLTLLGALTNKQAAENFVSNQLKKQELGQSSSGREGAGYDELVKQFHADTNEEAASQIQALRAQHQEADNSLTLIARYFREQPDRTILIKPPTDAELTSDIEYLKTGLVKSSGNLDVLKKAIEFQTIK